MSGFIVTGALLEDTGEITASATPVVLTPNSATILKLSGEGDGGSDQVLRMPASSNLQPGVRYYLANRSGVPAEIQDDTTAPFAKVEPGFEGEFRLLESGIWDASVYPSVKVGAEDLNLALVSNGQWSWSSNLLSLSDDAYVHIPGLPKSLNRIAKFPSNGILTYTVPEDTAASLAGLYVGLNSTLTMDLPLGIVGFYFWFQVNGIGVDPLVQNSIGFVVSIAQDSSAEEVASALSATILSSLPEYVTSVATGNTVTVTHLSADLISLPKVSTAFSVSFAEPQLNALSIATGNVAYTKVRRSLALNYSSPLEIFVTPLDVLDTDDADLFIIAQNIGSPNNSTQNDRVLIGNQLKLIPGETAELYANNAAKGSSGAIQFNRGDNILTADDSFNWDSEAKILRMGDLYITSLEGPFSLLDDQTTAVEIKTFDVATHKNLVLEYSLVRNGNPQVGHMLIVHDGTEVSIADNFVATSSLGVQFIASIDDQSLILSYKSSATGYPATLRYSMRYWA